MENLESRAKILGPDIGVHNKVIEHIELRGDIMKVGVLEEGLDEYSERSKTRTCLWSPRHWGDSPSLICACWILWLPMSSCGSSG